MAITTKESILKVLSAYNPWSQISEAHFRSSNSAISFCCLHFGILFADSDGSLMNQVILMFNVQSKSKSLC